MSSVFGVKLRNPFLGFHYLRKWKPLRSYSDQGTGRGLWKWSRAIFLFFLQFEKRHKMIIFFSSCEQVEFHYELLLKVISGGPELEQPERSSVSSARLQFLRLHGNMEQEVSILRMSGYMVLFCIPYDLLCSYFGEEGRREDRESFHL